MLQHVKIDRVKMASEMHVAPQIYSGDSRGGTSGITDDDNDCCFNN